MKEASFFREEPEAKIEKEKEKPALTVYLLRHGESGKNKSDPRRALTEKGCEQVKASFANIIDNTIREELPEFDQWDNVDAKKEAVHKAFANVEIHLRDSGTGRTLEQVWLEYDQLTELGVPEENIILPKTAYQWKEKETPQKAGPGVAKRLKGIQGLDQKATFRQMLDSPEYKKRMGTTDAIVAWALTPEDEIPEGVETQNTMKKRLSKDLAVVERFAGTTEDYPKRVIVVANSHSSIITLAASAELGIPIKELGEVENAEGLRFNFYGDKTHKTEPFGKGIEEKTRRA